MMLFSNTEFPKYEVSEEECQRQEKILKDIAKGRYTPELIFDASRIDEEEYQRQKRIIKEMNGRSLFRRKI